MCLSIWTVKYCLESKQMSMYDSVRVKHGPGSPWELGVEWLPLGQRGWIWQTGLSSCPGQRTGQTQKQSGQPQPQTSITFLGQESAEAGAQLCKAHGRAWQGCGELETGPVVTSLGLGSWDGAWVQIQLREAGQGQPGPSVPSAFCQSDYLEQPYIY